MDPTRSLPPGKLLIAGEWVDARSGKTFATVNPADESEIAQIAEAGAEDVDAAVAAGRQAPESRPRPEKAAADRGKNLRRLGGTNLHRPSPLSPLQTLGTSK